VHRLPLPLVLATLAVIVAVMAPLVLGTGTLYLRDVFSGHYEMKVAQAREMNEGRLPLVDVYRAGGQPLLGNPNALPLYPDNLLYLVASPLWALNAHFWLHLLLAPFAGYWLGRAWGLDATAAWIAGVIYASSGFYLSLFNLYNLIAGAALAPAFIAACLESRGGDRRFGAAAGALWALLLLAGDPLFAALALALAAAALVAAAPRGAQRQRRAGLSMLGGAIVAGTVVAAPMLVEMARILPMSFRGYFRYSLEAMLSQSWDPRSSLEWVLPLVFGRPDLAFWGQRYYGGNPPLLFSVFPGILALALVVVAGRPRTRAAAWGWVVTLGGLFFALGAWNPLVQLLVRLPGAAVLRYPVKFWLAVAIGASLLCGVGLARVVESARFRRRLLLTLLVFAAAYLGLGIFLVTPAATVLGTLDPDRLAAATLARELARARFTCWSLVAVALALAAAAWLWRRRPALGGALLLLVHLVSQLVLLQPLYDSDDTLPYTTPPAALEVVPPSSLVVHGGYSDLFGRVEDSPELRSQLRPFPDARLLWLTRMHFAQLYPSSGVQWGRRYALNHSPEGLDSFFVISLARAMQRMSDEGRLRILRASGVDRLLLDRPLDPATGALARLVARYPGSPFDLYVYEIAAPAVEVQLVGTIRRAPQMNAALDILTDPGFDPHSMAVLPGEGPEPIRPPGTARLVDRGVEGMTADVASPQGGIVVWQRSYLGLYRATVDGEPVRPTVVNFHRLGVEVPPGSHRVRIWAERRPTTLAFVAAALASGLLLVLALSHRRAPGPPPPTAAAEADPPAR
jgi:hypothetical protein